MSKLIGYARVSTDSQEFHLQKDALKAVGIEEKDIFEDKMSGAKKERPGLKKCLDSLKKGDTLVVWKLDRLGRSLRNLVEIIDDLREREINFKVLSGIQIDTNSPEGKLIFAIFAGLCEFERDLIRERTKAGLEAARARGRKGGRRPLDPNDAKIIMAKTMFKNKSLTIDQICKALNVSRDTVYRWQKV